VVTVAGYVDRLAHAVFEYLTEGLLGEMLGLPAFKLKSEGIGAVVVSIHDGRDCSVGCVFGYHTAEKWFLIL
jgi:hypothetical protein